ncbi:transforming growth factor beta receptor type 3-like [Rhinatrema bivittatum]|uniref:transforming growth factor beta receptor type 3-like n=1 Tax=Rhinatrema bivittatum TaxID=194408 RepID=UPI00112AA094|nr:transforming growth factor beta receptor type 3-like [Rhinatrema bivittatum]
MPLARMQNAGWKTKCGDPPECWLVTMGLMLLFLLTLPPASKTAGLKETPGFPPPIVPQNPHWANWVASPQSAPWENISRGSEEGWGESGVGSWEELAGGSSPEKLMSVMCLEKRMLIHVRKDVLLALGYSAAQVTLQDPRCQAQSNSSHFLLESPLTSCGTLPGTGMDSAPGVLLYWNAVLLRRDPRFPSPGNGSEETLPSRQAAEKNLQRIKFTCAYAAPSDLSRARLVPREALLRLEAYSSESFLQQCGPCIVPANSRVFIEAVLLPTDSRISFSVRLCRVSPSSDPEAESEFVVVRDACPADPGVTTYGSLTAEGSPAQEVRRFAFRLRPVYNESIQFLHCQLALCFKEGPWDAPKCRPQDLACAGGGGDVKSVSRSFLRTVSKPMIVTMAGEAEAPAHAQDSGAVIVDAQQEVEMGAVVGVSVSAFVIGVFLIGGLWLIYSQTDPGRTSLLGLPTPLLTVEKPNKIPLTGGPPMERFSVVGGP